MAAAPSSSSSALRATTIVYLMLSGAAYGAPLDGDSFGLTETLNGDFSARGFGASWINGRAFFYNRDGEMVIRDVPTNTSRTVVPQAIMELFRPESTTLSPDGQYVLISYDEVKVYRHSTEARFVIYDIAKNSTIEVREERIQLAKWSPVGSSLAYVYQNNIYYLPRPNATAVQITDDGVPGVIYNGAADWVNEEEVLSTDSAMWWSPDGARLAFARYDDSLVHNVSFMHYGEPGAIEDQYPTIVTIRYPKAGSTNPTVQLHVATLPQTGTTAEKPQQMVAPVNVTGLDHILDAVEWGAPNVLLASWSSRVADVKQFMFYTAFNNSTPLEGRSSLKLERRDGWLDTPTIHFRQGDPATFLTITWHPRQAAPKFRHVVSVTERQQTALTTGPYTVTAIYGWAPNGTVYYQATEPGQPSRRQVFAVESGGSPRCLSCNVTSPEGNACRWASASFSADFSWFALTCSGPDPTVVWLVPAVTPGRRQLWENNTELREQLSEKQQPQPLDDWLEVGGGLQAQVRMWLPPDLDPNGGEKRPAIVNVYAGPGSQQIEDSFGVSIQQYFTTSRRFIYIYIDGRGSDCKGDSTLFAVNRKLGGVEIQDQINVTRQLKEKYRFIDGNRTAIWGWSYGGYATAMALAQDRDDVFQCGVSVAPVSSWIYYDSIYTERYMGLPTPDDNQEGYNSSDVTRLAANFANKTYLLMHGTGDDNVHYQQSMALARALEDAGVLFRQQSYPDQDHSIGDLRSHVYRTLDEFLVECFDKQSPPTSAAARSGGGLLAVAPIARYVVMRHGARA